MNKIIFIINLIISLNSKTLMTAKLIMSTINYISNMIGHFKNGKDCLIYSMIEQKIMINKIQNVVIIDKILI